jgi:DNA-binding transcriptional MerR regulator
MRKERKTMLIGELAKRTGVNPKTIRYYEEVRVLPPAARLASRYRQYSEEDVERLEFIQNAKALGVTLEEIREVLAFRDRGVAPCPYVLNLLAAKVKEIQGRIRGLRMLAEDLRRLQRAAVRIPAQELTAKARFCHILENKQLHETAGARGH